MNCYTRGAEGVSWQKRVYSVFLCEVVISSKALGFLSSWSLRRISPKEVFKPELGGNVIGWFLNLSEGILLDPFPKSLAHKHLTFFFIIKFFNQKINAIFFSFKVGSPQKS